MNPALTTIAELENTTGVPRRTLCRWLGGTGSKRGSPHRVVVSISQALGVLAKLSHQRRAQDALDRLRSSVAVRAPIPTGDPDGDTGAAVIAGSPEPAAAPIHHPEWAAALVEAKVEIVLAFRDFHRESHLSLEAAAREFARLYNDDDVVRVSEAARHRKSTISAGRLLCDERVFRASGAAGLLPRYGNRLNSGLIRTTPELAQFILAMISGNPMIRSRQVHRALIHEMEQNQSCETFERFQASHNIHRAEPASGHCGRYGTSQRFHVRVPS